MSEPRSVDLVDLIERLRRDREAIDRDLAMLEGALAVAERYPATGQRGAGSGPIAPLPSLERTPTPPPRRTIPKLAPSVERLTEAQIEAFAGQVRGMTQVDAIDRVGAQVSDFQNADMVKIIIAAELTTGKRSNVSSHIYRLIVDSGKYEKVGPGRFRRADRAADDQGVVQVALPAEGRARDDLP